MQSTPIVNVRRIVEHIKNFDDLPCMHARKAAWLGLADVALRPYCCQTVVTIGRRRTIRQFGAGLLLVLPQNSTLEIQ